MYLLDTNTVIDFCNGKLPANSKDMLITCVPAFSVITHIELFSSSKISEEERSKLDQFAQIAIIYDNVNSVIVKHAIEIRKLYKTPPPDAIIAARALAYDFTLVTRNIADFKNIKGLKIIDPCNI